MRKMMLAVLALIVVPAIALAEQATDTFTVYAQVQAAGTCTVQSGAIFFGTIVPPITSNLDTSNSIGVSCPTSTPFTISLSQGTSGTYAQRVMTSSTAVSSLFYNLYTDASYGTVWGDGVGGTATVSGVGSGALQYLSVFGRVPPQSTPAAAADYIDNLTITVVY